MALILNIETATNVCSAALAKDGELLNIRENREGRSHASLLSYFIWEIISEEHLVMDDLDAVGISKGPGSYTGLRIGVSTAKGLCYGVGIPLISLHTLQCLTWGLVFYLNEKGETPEEHALFIPLLDARRMEVYSAVLDVNNRFIREVKAEVIQNNAFNTWLKEHPVYFFGNGVEKCREILKHPNARFIEDMEPSAKHMVTLAEEKFRNKQFEDLAYFEPFYLKDFIGTTPRKNPLD